ncbi:nitrite reductase large subunit NirB [Schlesneria paludicola]|uniref:nitrite reductase large subunit NirB n=1 Tax=Schlesneria paludicola TaxID=360056 RepID=UPI00058AFEA4|nr:nitrite reductase large subunit NirB [Schlesneria paludicola]
MISPSTHIERKTIVVVGNGMVGHRFCENMIERDQQRRYHLVTFCEEPRAAYDRVGLSKYFIHRDVQQLMLADPEWYAQNQIELHIGDRVDRIDRFNQTVHSRLGRTLHYDLLVLATGSSPFVPPTPGVDLPGCFVYRTIEDLDGMLAWAPTARSAAVIGGGLLGLEAAKAVLDMGLESHVIEFAPRLMPRQLDERGSQILVNKIESQGTRVHLNKSTRKIVGDDRVTGMEFADGQKLDVEMVVVSAGIRPRDELARDCGLDLGPRGGVVVNDWLLTSDPQIHAIGEVALHRGMIYGLVAPGYEMADVLAANLTGDQREFHGADLSTKLKLMGVDVASFGQYEADADVAKSLTFEDPVAGVYKKLLVTSDGRHLLGGMLVGDASDFTRLLSLSRSGKPLPGRPADLLTGGSATAPAAAELADDCQICSCNNVTKGAVCQAIRGGISNLNELKKCTKAGTGCGGCVPLVLDLLNQELLTAGHVVDRSLCEHFPFSRQDLFQIAKVKRIRTFAQLLSSHGQGAGCEICKPTIASILASLWNEQILEPKHATLQDTNDRFLANIQRGGLYSVVPRVPGGEITPDKLIALGTVAKKYGLYTKITGGQRVDLFGAPVHELPSIWGDLIDAGFESGHAYGKSLRTVKSCVGTTWCRYGVGDSVGFAIRIENRYKGLRSPHKLKGAVSGCTRECAEAQSKDFGLIATERGYNLYVCGNGGTKPRHADLLVGDVDEDTCLKYIDRFLMYYVTTADRLTRTSVWLGKLDGGIEHLRKVIVHDKLGIAADLEEMMQRVVDTYACEWKEVVNDPEKRRFFQQFVNSKQTEPDIEIVSERGQSRPADWNSDSIPLTQLTLPDGSQYSPSKEEHTWVRVGKVTDFPEDGGSTIRYGYAQIAVFNFRSRGEWYATTNMCPHKREFVLSRGILGDSQGEPKVACPLHKKTFSLKTGSCLTGDTCSIATYPVKIDGDDVLLWLPPPGRLAVAPAVEQRRCEGITA